MKKTKSVIAKVAFIVIVMTAIFSVGGGMSSPMQASNDGIARSNNSRLLYENMELRKGLEELEEKIEEMEAYAEQIEEYDNVLYSQILGVDYDTTDFYKYKNDSIDFIIENYDIIFASVNDRAFYAAEMLATQLIKLQETSQVFKNNKNAILYYPTIAPVKTKDFIYVSSPYGWRDHPTEKQVLFHEGIDISANVGSEVFSTAQGRVVEVMYSEYGYGNRILIKHAYGFETLYAHLGTINVKKGQWVRKNQLIGTVGNTGRSTGPHLHYEIHKNGEPRDPLGYFYTHITDELLAMN
jgi:murein DD-endopeptidase MepM/ murein hydrolase activator NlpD